MTNQYHYNVFFEIGQQEFKLYLYQSQMIHDDSVYTLKKIMEELNFGELLNRYSHLGRRGFNPIMVYCLIWYANMRGVRSVDRIVELCK